MDASTYEHNTAGSWDVKLNFPSNLKVVWLNDKKFEPLKHDTFEVKFVDNSSLDISDEDSAVQQFMKDWINRINNTNQTSKVEEDVNIEELIKNDDFSICANDKDSNQEIKVYSSGFKKNGKIDIGLQYSDRRPVTILRDCELKSDSSDDPTETNITFEYEHYD